MKLRFRKRHIIIAAVNLAAVISICMMTAVGSSMAKSQKYNYTADRWRNGGEGDFTQISSYFSDDSGFTTDSIQQLRGTFITELQNISVTSGDGQKLFPDAYSANMGTVTVKCDVTGRSDAELTAVGGDFFMFRSFYLLDGAYFSDSDLMQDGAVIDKNLAWSLYGSYNIAGMNIYINGVKFYISGVIDTPRTKYEQECVGELPKIYISYDGANMLPIESYNAEKFSKISCYECVLPDPVEDFAYSTVKKQFSETYKGKVSIVNNSERFTPKKRAKAFKKLADYAVRRDSVYYPYWENASRLVEFRLTSMYFFRRIFIAVPCITLAVLMIIALRAFKKWRKKAWNRVLLFIEKKRYAVIQKITQRKKET